eukprot:TRINITY_DN105883_c0_g1_i1.p2 TRINITY_DN105883_c0_g1~~TRINITY_DN105883_c0_g1_i1.p2  ORF type:complete len:183 (-),score=16.77 TRINITY_DN105883_c0_g1_i1:154-657(-)
MDSFVQSLLQFLISLVGCSQSCGTKAFWNILIEKQEWEKFLNVKKSGELTSQQRVRCNAVLQILSNYQQAVWVYDKFDKNNREWVPQSEQELSFVVRSAMKFICIHKTRVRYVIVMCVNQHEKDLVSTQPYLEALSKHSIFGGSLSKVAKFLRWYYEFTVKQGNTLT